MNRIKIKKAALDFPVSRLALMVSWVLVSGSAGAMQSIDDEELSSFAGQDGITLTLRSPTTGITAQSIDVLMDKTNTNSAGLTWGNVALRPIDANGNTTATPFNVRAGIDVGANGGAIPYLSLVMQADNLRMQVGALRHSLDATRSYGALTIDGDARFTLQTRQSIFNNTTADTYLLGQIGRPVSGTDGTGRVFYKQVTGNAPSLLLNNFHALWEMPSGTLGMTPAGIRMETAAGVTAASIVNIALDYDFLYKNAAATETITGTERPILHFGWLGSLRNVQLIWEPKGSWTGTQVASGVGGVGTIYDQTGAANQTAGLRFSSRFNYVSRADALTLGDATKEFRWQLGEAAAPASLARVNFELSDWATWGTNTFAHDWPLIAIDALSRNGAGPGGLCWGFAYNGGAGAGGACAGGSAYNRQFVDLAPGTTAGDFTGMAATTSGTASSAAPLALIFRKGNIQAYSRRVTFLDRNAAGTVARRDFNWGLIYTLSNVDGNVYFYPGGNPASINNGIIADIALMIQTFGATDNAATAAVDETYTQGFNWDKGFHLMIADTDVDKDGIIGEDADAMGIGFINSNLLLLADDTRIWVKPTANANDFESGGLDFMSRRARINFRSTFGGGVLPPNSTGQKVVEGIKLALNLEGMMNFRLSASHPNSAVVGDPNFVNARSFMGFSAAIRLQDTDIANFSESNNGAIDDGSFLSLAEPSNSSVDVRFARMTGDVALTNGRIDVRGPTEDGDNKPKLVISSNVQLGFAAQARMNDAVTGTNEPVAVATANSTNVFEIGAVKLGANTLGRVVIPSAQIFTSLTIKPQN